MVANYSWRLTENVVNIPRETPLEKADFSFCYQILFEGNFFVSGTKPCILSLSLIRPSLTWIYAGLVHADNLYEFIGIFVLLYLEDTVFLEPSTTSGSYRLSSFFSSLISELLGEDFD